MLILLTVKSRPHTPHSIDRYPLERARQFAFTFLEVLVSVGVLGILAGTSIWTLTQMNNYASVTRLYTGAETVAQNRIDKILSEAPFNPQNSPPEVPAVLALGTSAPETVNIYDEDPNVAGSMKVTGQLVTTITKSTTPGPGAADLNLYSATVVVTYKFRGKDYRVQFNAMRSSDV